MKAKTKLDTINKILAVILVITFIALILVISLYKGEEPVAVEGNAEGAADTATIPEFVAGNYGGVEFGTVDDVVNYYVEAYNYTKTLTAPYTENGNAVTYYKLLGDEKLEVGNVLVEGKSNSMIDGLVPGIVGGIFKGSVKGLPPCDNRDPNLDALNDGAINLKTSMLTPEDVLAANVKDNGDGTIDVTIQPKGVLLSMPGSDSQGRFFNTLGDISSTVESISVLSFSSGTINDNFVVDYKGGSGVITINTATKEIVKANYVMLVHIDVKHANVAVLKDKSAALDITYTLNFPATDDYLMESRGIARG